MTLRREVPRRLEGLTEVFAAVGEGLAAVRTRSGDVRRLRWILELLAEELFVNQLRHGRGGTDSILLEIDNDDESVILRLTDRAVPPFEPTSAPAPELGADPALRDPGGLGLHLVSSLADNVQWDHDGSDLTVTVTKRL